jgi:hypothetical protein
VPPQHSLRTDQQSEPTKRVDGKSVQQCREERPVAGKEPRTVPAQFAFQDGDLVPQRQDLHFLVPIAHGQQAQQREGVDHAQVGQSKQHSQSSCRAGRRYGGWQPRLGALRGLELHTLSTCMDEVIGRYRSVPARGRRSRSCRGFVITGLQ